MFSFKQLCLNKTVLFRLVAVFWLQKKKLEKKNRGKKYCTIDDKSLDLAVFAAAAAAALLGADLCPCTQSSHRLLQSKPHPVRESPRNCVLPETFLFVCQRGGRKGEQRRAGEEGRGEKAACFTRCWRLSEALRPQEQLAGWCAVWGATFIDFIHWIAEGQLWHLTAASTCSFSLVPKVSVPGFFFSFLFYTLQIK